MSAAQTSANLATAIKAQAYGLGFDLVGITTLGPVETAGHFEEWLSRGYEGDMAYLPRGSEKRSDSRLPFIGATTAIVVGLNYGGTLASGTIARYARGDDYHEVMWRSLDSLHEWIDAQTGLSLAGKSYVDTGPILERDLARRAGLGWQAKNTNLINPQLGSFFFIGALLIDLDLEPDAPFESDRCGTCTRCLDACPTGALVEPKVLDATRCISYLTIEAKGEIPSEYREAVGDLVYGCDICQDVCPWNISFSKDLSIDALSPRPSLDGDARTIASKLLAMDEEGFREIFKGSAMKRAKLRGLKRNAAVVLGNVGTAEDLPTLDAALEHADPMVAEHISWAQKRIERNHQT